MFILEGPFVSELLKETVIKYQIPVLETKFSRKLQLGKKATFLSQSEAIKILNNNSPSQVYSNSENAIHWVNNNLAHSKLPQQIDLFKNKIKFRELLKNGYPDLYFKEVKFNKLDQLKVNDLPFPFVIKPTVGFFSLGVYKVNEVKDWPGVKASIISEVETIEYVYPKEVLNISSFIIEENIKGTEYAFDAYFNDKGEPVILSILEHIFSSDDDVTDRVYSSSKEIIESNLENFTKFLKSIGDLVGLKNFPLHTEVRVDTRGNIVPIEINPMRFGGWCTTADFTYYSFGFNPYEYLHFNKKPNWSNILKDKEGKTYSNIVLTNTTGTDSKNIKSFDYDTLLKRFSNPLELRKADYKNFLIFGFLFTETSSENLSEIEWILKTDLKEFINN